MKLTGKITTFRRENNVYVKRVFNNVYWYGSNSLSTENKGKANGTSFIVETFDLNIDIELNDIVVLGDWADITSVSQLPTHNLFTVMNINKHLAGSKLDYITISGY